MDVPRVLLQQGGNFGIWRTLKWHCNCSFIRQIIVITDPSVSGFACLKRPMNESMGWVVLASARYVRLLVKMSVVVSVSINQSSSFKESYPPNVGISCSRVMVMFACIIVCMGSFLGWGFGFGCDATSHPKYIYNKTIPIY